jgi:uncharacterized protein
VSLYLDASAAVATLVEEGASAAVARFVREARQPLVVSDLTAAEVASAVSRLVRMKHLSTEVATMRLGEFEAWRASTTITQDFLQANFRLAITFVCRFDLGLRAPDALHAALCRRGGHQLATLDRRLADAAEALGVDVVRLG